MATMSMKSEVLASIAVGEMLLEAPCCFRRSPATQRGDTMRALLHASTSAAVLVPAQAPSSNR